MRLASACLCAALGAVTMLATSSKCFADSFDVRYLAAGVQTPAGVTTNYETFNSTSLLASTLTTTFNGSAVTGKYGTGFSIVSADQYGGAGGTGRYITTSSSYTLTLSSGVNYFGLWFSALDSGNQLTFYNGDTLLYTFTPDTYIALVGACPDTSNGYCGNPNSAKNTGQQYAYLNFYDTTGTFNKVTFTEISGGGGFESDNHAVAQLSTGTAEVGTLIVTPEPSPLILAFTGLAAIAGVVTLRKSRSISSL